MNDEELAAEIAAQISDEIGNRWYQQDGQPREMPPMRVWHWGPNATPAIPDSQAVFQTDDNRVVTVTVSVSHA